MNGPSDLRVVHATHAAGYVKFVVDFRIRKGVEREAAVALEVAELRRVIADEDV